MSKYVEQKGMHFVDQKDDDAMTHAKCEAGM